MSIVITSEDFLADRQGRTFADVATSSSRPFVAALEFFNDGDRQRRMEESEIHHDRALWLVWCGSWSPCLPSIDF